MGMGRCIFFFFFHKFFQPKVDFFFKKKKKIATTSMITATILCRVKYLSCQLKDPLIREDNLSQEEKKGRAVLQMANILQKGLKKGGFVDSAIDVYFLISLFPYLFIYLFLLFNLVGTFKTWLIRISY